MNPIAEAIVAYEIKQIDRCDIFGSANENNRGVYISSDELTRE